MIKDNSSRYTGRREADGGWQRVRHSQDPRCELSYRLIFLESGAPTVTLGHQTWRL